MPLLLVDGADRPTRTLKPGQTAVVFLDCTFARTGRIPPHLEHRLVLTVGEGATARRQAMDGIAVKVASRAPVRIDRPLRGGHLIALNGCCAKSAHARAVLPIGGRLVIAQRFAIDFVRFHGLSTFAGDRVHRGQVLALVGNTGNSTEPHLHFHVTSGPSPLASDGVPYVFRSFRYDARLADLDTGNPAIVPADPPRTRERQLPLDNDIIAFPPR